MTEVNDKLERLLRQSRAPRDVEFGSFGIDFYRTQLGDFVLNLLLGTKEYQDKAVSYLSFNVGAGVLAVGPGPLGYSVGRFYGNNVKVDDTDTINIHAEDIAVGKANDAERYPAVSVVAVIGPTQEDHASGLHTNTLHPCGRCRSRLAQHRLIRRDTLFVSAREDFKFIDVSDLDGITRLHDTNDPSGVTSFELHDSDELFTPLSTLEAQAPHVPEADDEEWQRTVGAHLVRRYVNLVNR